MACQCGCSSTPTPEGTDALQVPEADAKPEDLQRRLADLDQRVKDLETDLETAA